MTSFDFLPTRSVDPRVLLKMNDISPKVQRHLLNVYGLLACTTAAATAGAVFDMQFHVHGILSTLAMFGLMFVVLTSSGNAVNRLGALIGFGFCQGISIGQLVALAGLVDTTLVPMAIAATTLTFGAFAIGATLSQRRSLLYLYSSCTAGLSWLMWFSLANYFFQSRALFNVQLYAGLAVMMGFVAADTQKIIELADMGAGDAVRDAMELFVDVIGIFVRILIILIKNADSKKREENERRSKRR